MRHLATAALLILIAAFPGCLFDSGWGPCGDAIFDDVWFDDTTLLQAVRANHSFAGAEMQGTDRQAWVPLTLGLAIPRDTFWNQTLVLRTVTESASGVTLSVTVTANGTLFVGDAARLDATSFVQSVLRPNATLRARILKDWRDRATAYGSRGAVWVNASDVEFSGPADPSAVLEWVGNPNAPPPSSPRLPWRPYRPDLRPHHGSWEWEFDSPQWRWPTAGYRGSLAMDASGLVEMRGAVVVRSGADMEQWTNASMANLGLPRGDAPLHFSREAICSEAPKTPTPLFPLGHPSPR